MTESIGNGISTHTKALGKQLTECMRLCQSIEQQINAELENPAYEPYQRVFNRFKCNPLLRATLIGGIYPFEKFLDKDNRRIVRYVYGENNKRTKRDRSEASFKLSCGMGKVLHQSGGITEWKAGGSKIIRTQLWLYTKSIIVMGRFPRGTPKTLYKDLRQKYQSKNQPWLNSKLIEATAQETDTTNEIASLRLHFEFNDQKKGDRRVSATSGRFTRMLYKALLKEFGS